MNQRRQFWLLVTAMGVVTEMVLPFFWGLAAMIPILVASWWIVYRSEWF